MERPSLFCFAPRDSLKEGEINPNVRTDAYGFAYTVSH